MKVIETVKAAGKTVKALTLTLDTANGRVAVTPHGWNRKVSLEDLNAAVGKLREISGR